MNNTKPTTQTSPKRTLSMYGVSAALANWIGAKRNLRTSRRSGTGRAYSYYLRNY